MLGHCWKWFSCCFIVGIGEAVKILNHFCLGAMSGVHQRNSVLRIPACCKYTACSNYAYAYAITKESMSRLWVSIVVLT